VGTGSDNIIRIAKIKNPSSYDSYPAGGEIYIPMTIFALDLNGVKYNFETHWWVFDPILSPASIITKNELAAPTAAFNSIYDIHEAGVNELIIYMTLEVYTELD